MKITEIRALGAEELKKKMEDLHQELFNLKLRAATRQLASNREIPRVRRNIARMKTVLKERQLGIRE
ncbi:MAG: 50S ribosomal protein L29 [Chloroflexi bacterium RBG_16_48_7]|nr:MAG: 50S ribosomal protein L29 [Chloroflexi bacterium RBG_16_48_7]